MLTVFKSGGATLNKIDSITSGCWVDLVNPNEAEIDLVARQTGIQRELLAKMLDENELPRVEKEGDATMIVVDVPVRDDEDPNEYATFPLGVIISENNVVVTISHKNFAILKDFRRGLVRNFETAKKTRFLIQILTKTAAEYLKVLSLVYHQIEKKEDKLRHSTSNADLLELLATEKTLVYFTTSLKENSMVLEKLASGTALQLFDGDTDLLEDAQIETRQAVDMANIYSSILSSITGTYATVVSNNLNNVMKFFAGLTIILAVPTLISSFMGMNVPLGDIRFDELAWLKILLISILATALMYLWLHKKGRL